MFSFTQIKADAHFSTSFELLWNLQWFTCWRIFIYFKLVSVYVFECVFWTERDQQQSITENGNFDVKQQANGHHHSNVYRPTSHDP